MKNLCPALKAQEAAALRPANDSLPLITRLRDYATRGCMNPGSLTSHEIEQVSFALLVRLSLMDDRR